MSKAELYWKEKHFVEDLLNLLPTAIFWKNTDSIFIGCNQRFAEMAGLKSPKEIIGKSDYDLPWGETQAELYRLDDQDVIQRGSAKLNIEEILTLADGKEICLLTNKTPLFSPDGEVMGVLGIFYDITDRKNMELSLAKAKDSAEAASLAKDEFIRNMSHDIRTPLTGMIGISEILEREAHNKSEKEYARMINVSGETLLSLLNSVLEIVSASNARDHEVLFSSFNLPELIKKICDLEYPTICYKKLKLNINVADSVPKYLISDVMKLHRILLNLVGNAIKFTNQGTISIDVEAHLQESDKAIIQFRVSDTGIGMPEKELSKIFDKFYRSSPSYKGLYEGHGVGLYVVKKYCDILGAEIDVASELDVGTCFTIKVPFIIDHCQHQETSSSTEKASPLTTIEPNGMTPVILLVEDTTIALKIAESVVKQTGCRFLSATSGEQAFDLFKNNIIDIILTDVGLPGISGNKLASLIRKYEKEHHRTPVKIFGLTAHAADIASTKALKSGMNNVFSKPIKPDLLKKILSDALIEHYPSQGSIWLGEDLPPTEEELFNLEQFPLFDVQEGIKSIGSIDAFKELICLMKKESLTKDMREIELAHQKKDWNKIQKQAHKIKSSALYCHTTRLKYACQYLERYRKAGHTRLMEKLYQQFFQTVVETKNTIDDWLKMDY